MVVFGLPMLGMAWLHLHVPGSVEAAPDADGIPAQLARVAVPNQPCVLAWSADGTYLAGGAWGWGPATEQADPSEVYVGNIRQLLI